MAVIGATFAFCRSSDSESSFVSAQEITATRARVGHLVVKIVTCQESYNMIERPAQSGFNKMWAGDEIDEIKRGASSHTCCMLSTQQGMQAQGQNPKIDIYQSVLNLLNQE